MTAMYCASDGAPMIFTNRTMLDEPCYTCADCGMVSIGPEPEPISRPTTAERTAAAQLAATIDRRGHCVTCPPCLDNHGTEHCPRHAATIETCPDDEHEPNPDGTHCLRCGILAEPAPLSADALFLLTLPRAMTSLWPLIVWRANARRHDAIARAQLTRAELATAAALSGIVADPDALPLNTLHEPARDTIRNAYDRNDRNKAHRAARMIEATQRMTEAGMVWSAYVTAMRETYHGSTTRTDWQYDDSAERFELSPSGRWHGANRPPLYADLCAWKSVDGYRCRFAANHGGMHERHAAPID